MSGSSTDLMCIPRLTEKTGWPHYITVSWQLGKENIHLSSLPRDTHFSREGVTRTQMSGFSPKPWSPWGSWVYPTWGKYSQFPLPDIALEDTYKSTQASPPLQPHTQRSNHLSSTLPCPMAFIFHSNIKYQISLQGTYKSRLYIISSNQEEGKSNAFNFWISCLPLKLTAEQSKKQEMEERDPERSGCKHMYIHGEVHIPSKHQATLKG